MGRGHLPQAASTARASSFEARSGYRTCPWATFQGGPFGALGFFAWGRHNVNTALGVRYGGAHFRRTERLPAVGPVLMHLRKRVALGTPAKDQRSIGWHRSADPVWD